MDKLMSQTRTQKKYSRSFVKKSLGGEGLGEDQPERPRELPLKFLGLFD
jgi:hypothetical protein